MSQEANLDKEYLKQIIGEKFNITNYSKNLISFTYMEKHFFAIYVQNTFPRIGVLSDEKINYPHFISWDDEEYEGIKIAILCLFIREEIIEYKLSYEEKVDYIISQFTHLMNLSLNNQKKEITKEFQYHWQKVNTKSIISMIQPNEKYLNKIKVFTHKDKDNTQKKILSKSFPKNIKEKYVMENCIYIDIYDLHGILPPSYEEWDTKKLCELFFSLTRNRFDEETAYYLEKLKVKKKTTIFLRLKELNNFEIGMVIYFKKKKADSLRNKLLEVSFIEYIKVFNVTIEHSLIRNGQKPLVFKNVLVIGVGSLGSYIVNELPKMGVKKIALVDNDILTYDNLSRHVLGEPFIGRNKSNSLKFLLETNYSYLSVNAINKRVTAETIAEIIAVENDYDLILVLTGNEDLQYMINKYLLSLEKFIPTIFCWLEANSIGAHALVMKEKDKGCYNCVLEQNLSYLDRGQSYIKYNGCGGTYTEYGNSILLETTSMMMKILNKFDTIENNAFYSYKTEQIDVKYDSLSMMYKEDRVGINILHDIKRSGCDICD